MTEVIALQNQYAQLFQQVLIRLNDIIKGLKEQWKEAKQEYQSEIQLLKVVEEQKRRIKWLKKREAELRVIATEKNTPDSLKALTQEFLKDYDTYKTTLQSSVNMFETEIARDAKTAEEKAKQLGKELKRLEKIGASFSKEVPAKPVELRKDVIRPIIAWRKLKYKKTTGKILVGIADEIITLLQTKFFEPNDIAKRRLRSSELVKQIDLILSNLNKRLAKFNKEYNLLLKEERLKRTKAQLKGATQKPATVE